MFNHQLNSVWYDIKLNVFPFVEWNLKKDNSHLTQRMFHLLLPHFQALASLCSITTSDSNLYNSTINNLQKCCKRISSLLKTYKSYNIKHERKKLLSYITFK